MRKLALRALSVLLAAALLCAGCMVGANAATAGAAVRGDIGGPEDITALTERLAQARAIAKGNYTEASWNTLQIAIHNAQVSIDAGYLDQVQLNFRFDILQSAIDGLVDLTALIAKLEQARAIDQWEKYTGSSYNALQIAISKALPVVHNTSATQAQVDAQVTALQNAIDGLEGQNRFWFTWPPFFQWILRHVLFGWVWMNWY